MKKGFEIVSSFRTALLLFFVQILMLAAAAVPSHDLKAKDLPLSIELGYEANDFSVKDGSGKTVASESSDRRRSSSPVLSVLSPTYLACITNRHTFTQNESAVDWCVVGLGLRFSAGQKRLSGPWFGLQSDPAAAPRYSFDSNQIGGELLFGYLLESQPVASLGIRAGYNIYDLLVYDGNTILAREENESGHYLA